MHDVVCVCSFIWRHWKNDALIFNSKRDGVLADREERERMQCLLIFILLGWGAGLFGSDGIERYYLFDEGLLAAYIKNAQSCRLTKEQAEYLKAFVNNYAVVSAGRDPAALKGKIQRAYADSVIWRLSHAQDKTHGKET